MNNKFFTFAQPYLSYIDNGSLFRKPFAWLYGIIGVLNLILPIFVLFKALDAKIFSAPASYVIAFLLVWVIICFAAWISFQIWWNRMGKVVTTSDVSSDFVAVPVFSHFIQTLGEWAGTWIALVGTLSILIVMILVGGSDFFYSLDLPIPIGSGILGLILTPIYGFLVIVVSRLIAELWRALAAIANNTKR